MASACNHAHQVERYWDVSLMGPYSEQRQFQRAEAIQRLLDTNPQLDIRTKTMWENHLQNLCKNETTYNYRVKTIYSKLKPRTKGWVTYE